MCLTYACNINVEKDIVCYKVYLRRNNMLISPYQLSLAPEFNTVAKTDLGEIGELLNSVFEGFHSFANFCDSMKEAENWASYSIPVIIKCLIPKGAKCYVGQFEGKVSYCSDSIKLIEIIPD